jgi:lysine biosynthesis protein LysW
MVNPFGSGAIDAAHDRDIPLLFRCFYRQYRRCKMTHSECPNCGMNIRFKNSLKLYQAITCPTCSERLQVVELEPLELDYEYAEEEDYEGYDPDNNNYYQI